MGLDENVTALWSTLSSYYQDHKRWPTQVELKRLASETGFKRKDFVAALEELHKRGWVEEKESDGLRQIVPKRKFSRRTLLQTSGHARTESWDEEPTRLETILDEELTKQRDVRLQELQRRLTEAESSITNARKEARTYKDQLDTTKGMSAEMEAKLQEVDEIARKKQEEYDTLRKGLEELSMEQMAKDDLIAMFEERVAEVEVEAAEREDEARHLESLIKLKEEEARAKGEQLRRYNEKFNQIRSEMSEKDRKIEELQRKLEQQEEEEDELELALDAVTAKQQEAVAKMEFMARFYREGCAEFQVVMTQPDKGVREIIVTNQRVKIRHDGHTEHKAPPNDGLRVDVSTDDPSHFVLFLRKNESYAFRAANSGMPELLSFVIRNMTQAATPRAGTAAANTPTPTAGGAAGGGGAGAGGAGGDTSPRLGVAPMKKTRSFFGRHSRSPSSVNAADYATFRPGLVRRDSKDTLDLPNPRRSMRMTASDARHARNPVETRRLNIKVGAVKASKRGNLQSNTVTDFASFKTARADLARERHRQELEDSLRNSAAGSKEGEGGDGEEEEEEEDPFVVAERLAAEEAAQEEAERLKSHAAAVSNVRVEGKCVLGDEIRAAADVENCEPEHILYQWARKLEGDADFVDVEGANTPVKKLSINDLGCVLRVTMWAVGRDGEDLFRTFAVSGLIKEDGKVKSLIQYHFRSGEVVFFNLDMPNDDKSRKWRIVVNRKKIKLRVGNKTKHKDVHNEAMRVDPHMDNPAAFTLHMNSHLSFDLVAADEDERDVIALVVKKFVCASLAGKTKK